MDVLAELRDVRGGGPRRCKFARIAEGLDPDEQAELVALVHNHASYVEIARWLTEIARPVSYQAVRHHISADSECACE